jgi:flavin reductase (DIM6/NTAB) family NADH-FMN oxidoreductase RutF
MRDDAALAGTFVPEGANQRAFRDALGRFATGITVVTVAGRDGPVGFTANSFASVSLDPPLVLWSPAKASSRYVHYAEAAHFTIHVLGAEQEDLSRRFSRGGAGFEGMPRVVTPEGVPVIPGTLARFDCVHHDRHDGGDHLIVVGRVLRASHRDGPPLVFHAGALGRYQPGL